MDKKRLPSNLRQTTANARICYHVEKTEVTPFDPPYPKTPCWTQTLRLYMYLL